MDAAPLHIRTLGKFSIRYQDTEISVSPRSRKLCLLLAFLLQERNRVVFSGELTGLFSGEDAPDTAALNALKAILHRARTFLDQLWEGAGHTLILSREGGYQWNPEFPLVLDREEFLRLCQLGDRSRRESRRLARYLEALALYQGDYLSPLTGHPWADQEAERLHQHCLRIALDTLTLLDRQQRWQEAAEVSGAAIALEPCHEELCRAHMRALLQMDRRSEALRTYEEFQDQLLIRSGVMPSDQLRELYRLAQGSGDPRSVTPANLLERILEEHQPGAMLCEYDFFCTVCRSMARMAERTGAALHVVLISLAGTEPDRLAQHSLDRAMAHLQEIIRVQLRRGDVFTQCSASQFILLLPMADYPNSQMITTRILRAFARQYPHSPVRLQTSVQPLRSAQPEDEA